MAQAPKRMYQAKRSNDRAGEVRCVMRNAGLSPERLAELPFEQAVELLSQADIGSELSDDQAITLVGFLLSSRRHG